MIIASDAISIAEAQAGLGQFGTRVESLQADLSTTNGVDKLLAVIGERPADALMANAGRGLGHAFLDQDWDEARFVVDTNVTGTIYLLHKIGRDMRERDRGKILITGSIAGLMPGSFQAVYNGTKAFLDSFAWALRNELKDTNVTVSCLMPGPTDTEFFERADMLDTKVGADPRKADPADVAKTGYTAMLKGEGDLVAGYKNKLQAAMAEVTPRSALAEQHRKMAEPGSNKA